MSSMPPKEPTLFSKPFIVMFHVSTQFYRSFSMDKLTKVNAFFDKFLSKPLCIPITSMALLLGNTGDPLCPFSVWHSWIPFPPLSFAKLES